MCLVRSHTNGVSLYKSREQTDNQMYKMCLVSNRPATSSSTLGIITQSHWSQLLFHLGSVRSTYSDTTKWAHIVQRVHCAFKKKTTQNISSIPRISSRGTGSTFYISQHERRVSPCKPSQYQKRLFAINVHCKKKSFYLYTVFCASLFLLLC